MGKIDGKGYKIMDLYINLPNEDFIGLFSHVASGGDIIKVTIEACQITGKDYVGGLISWNEGGTILNSSITGLVEGRDYIGGLTGWNASDGSISVSSSMGLIKGENSVGGLVGLNDESTVSDSFSTGIVNGYSASVGGLIGYGSSGSLFNCYSMGLVEGTAHVGGLIGIGGGTVNNSYWDIQTSGQSTSQIEAINNVNSNVVGDYTVEYSVTDSDGNTSSLVTRLVYVKDTTSPNITLNGDNPMAVECGSVFVDPNAEAIDTCDSEVSVCDEINTNNKFFICPMMPISSSVYPEKN